METKYYRNSEGIVWQLSDGRVIGRFIYNDPLRKDYKIRTKSFEDFIAFLIELENTPKEQNA